MLVMKQSFRINFKGFLLSCAGASFLVIYNEFFFTGLINGLAGAGGILVTTLVPLVTFALGCVLSLKAPSTKDFFGLFIGACGAMIIMELWNTDMNLLFASGNIYFLAAALTWAVLTHTSARAKRYTSAYTFSFYLFFLTSLFELILLYLKGTPITVNFNAEFTLNIILIAVGATTFGTTIYFVGTNKLGGQKASSFIFLVPLNALLMSYFFLDEPLKLNTIAGGILAVSAVYIINHVKKRPTA
jgi:drug/metabolite transporter (DMT)-like permease